MIPEALPYVLDSYNTISFLCLGEHTINSCEGVQQGDPLGPLLFCLGIHKLLQNLTSEVIIGYLDDISLCGDTNSIIADLTYIETESSKLGLSLNKNKCEIFSNDTNITHHLSTTFTNFVTRQIQDLKFLGAPILPDVSLDEHLDNAISKLKAMENKLVDLSSQDALFIIRNSLALPKLNYILRATPCSGHHLLNVYDDNLRLMLINILNISLTDSEWAQATLPIGLGGLGVRKSAELAPSAYLASAAASLHLVDEVLPMRLNT